MTSVRTPPSCADHFRLSLSPIYDLSRAELYRLPVITAHTFFASHGSFQPTEPLLILSPANYLRQIHVICMSNHAACTYPGAASRAGFPLDPMGHLCGPPCLSPRLPHRVIRISPSKGSQSQSSECSPDTNNNQSTNDTCRLVKVCIRCPTQRAFTLHLPVSALSENDEARLFVLANVAGPALQLQDYE